MQMGEYNTDQFEQDLKELGIVLDSRQMEQFIVYYEMLVEWNQVKMCIRDSSGSPPDR